jgi:hypothetical protein
MIVPPCGLQFVREINLLFPCMFLQSSFVTAAESLGFLCRPTERDLRRLDQCCFTAKLNSVWSTQPIMSMDEQRSRD